MTNRRYLTAEAVYRAIQWEESLADAWQAGSPERLKSQQLAAQFRELLRELGYREPKFSGKAISIFDIPKSDAL